MKEFADFSLMVKNFKCFGEEAQGFGCIKAINLLLGRNNSGKSSLLDVIKYATSPKTAIPQSLWHSRRAPEFLAEAPLTQSQIKHVFPETVHGSGIPARNHYEFGEQLIGSKLTWRLDTGNYVRLGPNPKGDSPLTQVKDNVDQYRQRLVSASVNPFHGKEFRRISAERNIGPERHGQLTISSNGQGITNSIQNFLSQARLPSDLIEKVMLRDLNQILGPDTTFRDIVCQQIEDGLWEIFLEEEQKGRIPLSESGSGLKTIIMVLCYIHLLPAIQDKELSQFVFAFEELENNLHPSLLRRLLLYIRHQAMTNNCVFFLTSHSSVAIDIFRKDKEVQILHVTHDGSHAKVRAIATYIDNRGILDDLDIRASDLLQANGIIWVEGPSDRIYVNRWIDLWTQGGLSEDSHYQCVFYGGRLLAHISSREPDTADEAVSILRVNRNAAMLMDSDKKTQHSRLNSTKQRLISEIKKVNGLTWVTRGREIENYIPAAAVAAWIKRPARQVGPFVIFSSYLESLKSGTGKRYQARKALLAEQLIPNMTKEDLEEVLDFAEKIDQLCAAIRRWNNL